MPFDVKNEGEKTSLDYAQEYTKAMDYINSDNIAEGLDYFTQMGEKFGTKLTTQDQLILDVLTCILLNRENKIEENLNLISKLDKVEFTNQLMMLDFTIIKADTFWKAGKTQEALGSIEEIEDKISQYKNTVSVTKNDHDYEIIEREVDINNTKGIIYWYLGDVRNAQKSFELAFKLVSTLRNKMYLANTHNNLGNIYSYQGELQLALDHHNQALKIRKELPNKVDLACSLANIGEMYQYMSIYDSALDYYKQAQSIFESLDIYIFLAQLYHDLINVYLILNNIQEAKLNLKKLKDLNSRHGKNLIVNTYYILAEGLVLKVESSLMRKFKAADNFMQIANDPVVDQSLTAQAIFNLTDLLLLELKLSKNEEKLTEVHIWLHKLSKLADDLNSPVLQAQTYLLLSKLKLLEFKVEEAVGILITAQGVTQQKGMKKYEIMITRELDQLVSKKDEWEDLRLKGASMVERIEYTGLAEILDNLIRKRQERPELVEVIMENIDPSVKSLPPEERNQIILKDFYKVLSKETYITIYRQFKLGPEIYVSDELYFSKTPKELLETKLGVFFITAIGQGDNSNEGLFGPLPFPDSPNYISLIYSCFMNDPENEDPRAKGRSYCMFVVTFQKIFEPYFSNRNFLAQIFDKFQNQFEKIQDIKISDLIELKSRLIK